jgi:hypothetical protein
MIIGNKMKEGARDLASKAIHFINVREHLLKRKLTNHDSRVRFNNNSFLKVNILKEKGAVFTMKGTISFANYLWNTNPNTITLCKKRHSSN